MSTSVNNLGSSVKVCIIEVTYMDGSKAMFAADPNMEWEVFQKQAAAQSPGFVSNIKRMRHATATEPGMVVTLMRNKGFTF